MLLNASGCLDALAAPEVARQLDSFVGFQQAMREYMAHTDAKFTQAADMFIQLGGWVRAQGDEIVRTNERIEELLRALLRGRGDGEGTDQA